MAVPKLAPFMDLSKVETELTMSQFAIFDGKMVIKIHI